MEIEYFGHSCFKIKTERFSLLIDPFSNVGIKEPKVTTDYYFCTHNHYDHNNFIISGGKALDENVNHKKISTFHDDKQGALRGKNDVLLLQDDLTVAHLGDLGEVDNKLIDALFGVDIIMCPIGGKYTIDYKQAICLINKVQPKVVIPMHYKLKNSTIDVDKIDNFLKEINFSIKYMPSKININKGGLLSETQIFVLEVKGE